ncbi:MAG: hypothetical protein ACRDRT_12600 [Pseudonocardiaceae bacterium]
MKQLHAWLFCVALLVAGTAAPANADDPETRPSSRTNGPSSTPPNCSIADITLRPNGVKQVVCGAHKQGSSVIYRPPIPSIIRKFTKRPTPKLVRVPSLGRLPDNDLCWEPGSVKVTPEELAHGELAIWSVILKSFPRCPTAVPEKPDPEETAIDVLERFPLPAPKPFIAPGRAITGLRAFLEPRLEAPFIAGHPSYAGTRSTALGDMAVEATAVFYVDWGDETTGPHAGPGGPWPKGNISHVWTDQGPVDVVVTAEWTVHWRMGTDTGTLTVPTEGTITAFPVGQLQAVINR